MSRGEMAGLGILIVCSVVAVLSLVFIATIGEVPAVCVIAVCVVVSFLTLAYIAAITSNRN